MVKGKPAKGLGKAVIKSRFKRQNHQHDGESFLHTTEMNDGYDWGRLNLQSVTEESNLKDFLSTAELAGTEFTAEKLNVKFVDPSGSGGLLSREDEMKTQEAQEEHKEWLRIPRRPEWDSTTSPEDLDKKERESFLEWRRKLAQLQEVENIMLTPFEKNLDFWRQLWRVIERSDIIVQIVDARNPLLFRCEDLETYVKELSKEKINILLINKADYLSQSQREVWYDYFTGFCSDKIKVVFWSAVNEAKRQEAVEKEAKSYTDSVESDTKVWNVESIPMEDDDEECGISKQETEAAQTFSDQKPVHSSELSPNELECNPTDILNGPQLIDLFKTIFKTNTYQTGVTTVGMVGYPNVGKSSTINAILQMKKVPVSATPGRTKHFQTLYVDKELMLCDCPGLVFPSFVSTKAELILNGVLPVDQMRDHVPPISLLCQHIPRSLLEQLYGINIPKPGEGEDSDRAPRASELLKTYAYMRGFFSSKGVPDCARASRIILKDYITGRLLYCNPPPSISPTNFQSASPLLDSVISQPVKTDRTVPGTSEMDQEFFSEIRHKIHSKGAHGVSDFARSEGLKQISRSGEASLSSSQISVSDKPWKKHNNRNKKEKTRRIYAHLDKH